MRAFYFIVVSLFSLPIAAQNYETQEITSALFQHNVNKTGKLAFKRTLNLSFKATGYLKVLTVDEGEYFAVNDTLAALETTELDADKNAKYATLINAKRNVERLSELIAKNLSSAQALDAAKTSVENARAAYRSAFYNLEKAQIIAPFSGQVIKRFTNIGELQSPAKPAFSIAALNKNWVVKVALTGTEIGQVVLNQTVNVRLTNAGSITGKVSKIPAQVNAETQLFTIEVLLPNVDKQHRLIAGQLAQVSIGSTTDQPVFEVPIEALVNINQQGDAVLMTTLEGNAPSEQVFTIYKLSNRYIYVTAENINNSITVVTHGWHNLQ